MAKTKAEKQQEAHIAAELELFESQGKRFRCRGSQEQDVAKVVARIEASQRTSERAAVAAERRGEEEAAGKHRRKAEEADVLGQATLRVAQQLTDEGSEPRTGLIVGRMAATGGPANALDNVARNRCGQDLAETIAALPRDGHAHDYTCPKCGREGHVSKTGLAEEA